MPELIICARVRLLIMIVDAIKNINRYPEIIKGCDAVKNFFDENPPQSLQTGKKYEIAGLPGNFSPVQMEPKLFTEKQWEGHRLHGDIHFVIRGKECLYWIPLSNLKEPVTYNSEADVEFYADQAEGSGIVIEAGYFIYFTPEDIHKPIIAEHGCNGIKLLIKTEC